MKKQIIVMYNGIGKSLITNAFMQYIEQPVYQLYTGDEYIQTHREDIKSDLAVGIGYIFHSNDTNIKDVKRELGIALSRRSIFIDMSHK